MITVRHLLTLGVLVVAVILSFISLAAFWFDLFYLPHEPQGGETANTWTSLDRKWHRERTTTWARPRRYSFMPGPELDSLVEVTKDEISDLMIHRFVKIEERIIIGGEVISTRTQSPWHSQHDVARLIRAQTK